MTTSMLTLKNPVRDKKNHYYATGHSTKKGFRIKKGSCINPVYSSTMCQEAKQTRIMCKEKGILQNYTLTEDIMVSNETVAKQFVTGTNDSKAQWI